MIHEIKAFTASCDNCGETFSTFHNGYSIFVDESSLQEYLNEEDWYDDGTDPEHMGKQYCPNCFKNDPEEDDKIIIDTTRTKTIQQ